MTTEGSPITEKQLAANRANAQKSSGPRSLEGKKRSSKNSIKHGLLSRECLLFDENKDLFQKFAAGIRSDIKPRTPIEAFLTDALVSAGWRWRRCLKAEQGLLNSFTADSLLQKAQQGTTSMENGAGDSPSVLGEAYTRGADSPGLDLVTRYESRHQKAFQRLLGELRRVRADREWRAPAAEKTVREINPT